MRWRSYKRWGFKDECEQDQFWIPETHPYYMESARSIPNYVVVYRVFLISRLKSGTPRVLKAM